MESAKDGDVVRVHYICKLEDGEVLDSSVERAPLVFEIGGSHIMPFFERVVVGMRPGELRIAEMPAHEAFGPHREEKVVVVEREAFPSEVEPAVGMQLKSCRDDGKTIIITVTDITESSVTLDVNHPLAGKALIFEVMLEDIVQPFYLS